ncbi:MAG: ribonuclease P protein component [Cycloclasticus sp.]|nr:ribonuclease P protein component [Cycloclasticus sp.]
MKDYTFTKKVRLNSSSEYARVFKGAKRSTDSLFTVLAQKNVSSAKLGLAIAKKNVKKAVKRNLIKRIVRESFRHEKERLSGYDFVILCRHKAALATKKELAKSISKHWDKLIINE